MERKTQVFTITEETEIIGTDERVRTKLYLYKLCRARRRRAKPITEKAMYSVSNSISGIIMVIMIISFRDKTNTDEADHADNKRKFLCELDLLQKPYPLVQQTAIVGLHLI